MCSSRETALSTRRHLPHPVSVSILAPREIQALWSQNHDAEILHRNAVNEQSGQCSDRCPSHFFSVTFHLSCSQVNRVYRHFPPLWSYHTRTTIRSSKSTVTFPRILLYYNQVKSSPKRVEVCKEHKWYFLLGPRVVLRAPIISWLYTYGWVPSEIVSLF